MQELSLTCSEKHSDEPIFHENTKTSVDVISEQGETSTLGPSTPWAKEELLQ